MAAARMLMAWTAEMADLAEAHLAEVGRAAS
jgi:hypothetical protein